MDRPGPVPPTTAAVAGAVAVRTEALTKTFGGRTAVDRLDLTVETGTVLAVLGPNGAGKTTTVRMLATLTRPTSGVATVCGLDVVREADAVRNVLSLTGQFAALEDHLTAEENLLLVARLRGFGRRRAVAVVADLVERFELGEVTGQLVKSVSGGQRRRIDLAASLVTRPRLLVLDEPTTGLDPRSRQVVWSTVRDLAAEGVTVLLTTQYLEEADALADRILLVDRGRAVAEGRPSELKSRIGDQRVDVAAVDGEGLDRLVTALTPRFELRVTRSGRRLSIPAPDELTDLRAVTDAVAATGVPVEEVALRRPTLDDAFLALTGRPASGQTGTSSGGAAPRPAPGSSPEDAAG